MYMYDYEALDILHINRNLNKHKKVRNSCNAFCYIKSKKYVHTYIENNNTCASRERHSKQIVYVSEHLRTLNRNVTISQSNVFFLSWPLISAMLSLYLHYALKNIIFKH